MALAECAVCSIVFTSVTAFDKHLGALTETGYEHKTPEEAGLVVSPTGRVSLPPPDAKAFWRKIERKKNGRSAA